MLRLAPLALMGLLLSASAGGAQNRSLTAALKRAQAYEVVEDYKQAAEIARLWLAADDGVNPKMTAIALFYRSKMLWFAGDLNEAATEMLRAGAKDPGDPRYASELKRMFALMDDKIKTGVYSARRRTGSASRLRGRVGVLHIFVDGSNTEAWERRGMMRVAADSKVSGDWLDAKAGEFGVTDRARFTHRYMALPRSHFIGRMPVPTHNSTSEHRKQWITAVMRQLQAGSMPALFSREFKKTGITQGLVVFHSNIGGTSFALSEGGSYMRADMEHAFVRGSTRDLLNTSRTVVFTHELLHTFGADDLYNKVREPEVNDRDIMNNCNFRLSSCEMSPLTAYAIGWTDAKPRLGRLQLLTTGF